MGRSECGTAASGTTWAPCGARLARRGQQVQQARPDPQVRRGQQGRRGRRGQRGQRGQRPTSRSFFPAAPGPNPPESPLSTWRSSQLAVAVDLAGLALLPHRDVVVVVVQVDDLRLESCLLRWSDPRKWSQLEPAAVVALLYQLKQMDWLAAVVAQAPLALL